MRTIAELIRWRAQRHPALEAVPRAVSTFTADALIAWLRATSIDGGAVIRFTCQRMRTRSIVATTLP